VGGRRRVHHHLVAGRRADEAHQLDQADQLVDARQAELEETAHVLAVEIAAALGDRLQIGAARAEPAVEGLFRVELGGEQPAAAGRDGGRLGAEIDPQGIAQGMGGIGRDQENLPA
jgi:hypothetical protein